MGDRVAKASRATFVLAIGVFALALAVGLAAIFVPALSPLQMAIIYVVLPATLLWLWHRDGNAIPAIGLGRPGGWKRDLGTGFLIGLISPLALISLLMAVGLIAVRPSASLASADLQMPLYTLAAITMTLSIVKLAFVVPLEEITFRGLYLKQMGPMLGPAGSLVASSLFFSLLHVPVMIADGVWAMPLLIALSGWFIFGLALGAGALRKGGLLWLPIGVHFGYNLLFSSISVLLTIVYCSPVELAYLGPDWLTGQTRWSPETGMAGLILEISILLVVLTVTRVRAGRVAGN